MFAVARGKGPFFYKRIHRIRRVTTGWGGLPIIKTWCSQQLLDAHQCEDEETARSTILFDRRQPQVCIRCIDAERNTRVPA